MSTRPDSIVPSCYGEHKCLDFRSILVDTLEGAVIRGARGSHTSASLCSAVQRLPGKSTLLVALILFMVEVTRSHGHGQQPQQQEGAHQQQQQGGAQRREAASASASATAAGAAGPPSEAGGPAGARPGARKGGAGKGPSAGGGGGGGAPAWRVLVAAHTNTAVDRVLLALKVRAALCHAVLRCAVEPPGGAPWTGGAWAC